jgi:hypothetical protein
MRSISAAGERLPVVAQRACRPVGVSAAPTDEAGRKDLGASHRAASQSEDE